MIRFAYILTCIALYSAVTLAAAWALWQVIPAFVGWAQGKMGTISTNIVMLILPFSCWGAFYFLESKG